MKPTTLRAARNRRKWTQDVLAEKSGVDQTTISNLECGRTTRPSFDTVLKLAKALGIASHRLVFAESAPDEDTVSASDDRVGHTRKTGAVA